MLVAAVSGGAAIPPMTGAVATATGNDFHKAMAIPTAFYVLAWAFPIYANTVSRDLLDGHRTTDVNVTEERNVLGKGGEVEMQAEGKSGTERVEDVAAP